MSRLSDRTLGDVNAGAQTPGYERAKAGIGIVHIGPGAFHRAHQAVFTDRAMEISGGDWGICGISLNSRATAEDLSAQDGLYTLAIKDVSASHRIIGSMKKALCAKDDPAAALAQLTAPQTKFVTLTITEKGYALTSGGDLDKSNARIAADLKTPDSPASAIGYLVKACALRKEAGTPPLTIISCDNLPANGDKLRTVCIQFAKGVDVNLASHIRNDVRFPNTMVDSITPATDDGVLADVEAAIGLTDKAPVQREAFAQWVIEDNLPDERPDWAAAGATITPDVHIYEMAKLRVLNGAHSTLTYLGLLTGKDTVLDAINNDDLRGFVSALIERETLPTLTDTDGMDLPKYWSQIRARFENPNIRHLLEQISHDGSQKIPARILPVIEYHLKNDHIAPHACFVLAAWIAFNQQRRTVGNPPTDAFLTAMESDLPDPALPADRYAGDFLNLSQVIPAKIGHNPRVRAAVMDACLKIAELGTHAAIIAAGKNS